MVFKVVRHLGRLQIAVSEGMQGSKTVCQAFQSGGTEKGTSGSRRECCHRHAKQTGQAGRGWLPLSQALRSRHLRCRNGCKDAVRSVLALPP